MPRGIADAARRATRTRRNGLDGHGVRPRIDSHQLLPDVVGHYRRGVCGPCAVSRIELSRGFGWICLG